MPNPTCRPHDPSARLLLCAGRKPAGLLSQDHDRGQNRVGDYLARAAP